MERPEIVTRVATCKGWRNIKPEKAPVSSTILDLFLHYNNAPRCFVRLNKGWYKLKKTGEFVFAERALYKLSYLEWLEIARDSNFAGNIPNINYTCG